jgi:D-lactate dehydrogenase (cytochrome)
MDYNLKLKTEEGTEYKVEVPYYQMPKVKNASGFYAKENMDAIDLFIGSEGTLGIITQIKLKLLPLPSEILSAVIFFNNEEDALEFIISSREKTFCTRKEKSSDIDALALEYFDAESLRFLKSDYPNIPGAANAAVWFEQETGDNDEEYYLGLWSEIIEKYNGDIDNSWFAFTEADKERIKGFRHAVSAKVNEYISSKGLKKLGTDVAVPDDHFKKYYIFCKDEAEKSGLEYVIYGHFGNSHIHLNILPRNGDEVPKGRELYFNICKRAAELGGTVSAEHGIGKIKPAYLELMYGEETIRKMANLKKQFDPRLILGIGNMIGKNFFD